MKFSTGSQKINSIVIILIKRMIYGQKIQEHENLTFLTLSY